MRSWLHGERQRFWSVLKRGGEESELQSLFHRRHCQIPSVPHTWSPPNSQAPTRWSSWLQGWINKHAVCRFSCSLRSPQVEEAASQLLPLPLPFPVQNQHQTGFASSHLRMPQTPVFVPALLQVKKGKRRLENAWFWVLPDTWLQCPSLSKASENLTVLTFKFQEQNQQEPTQHRLKYLKLHCLDVPKT